MADGLTAAEVIEVANALVDPPPSGWVTVLDSGTSVVLRGGGFVVKHPRRGGDSFDAEVFGLRAMAPRLPGRTPAVVAVDTETRVLVMTDLGEGDSVADLLLGDDPEAAARGLFAQATTLARLHNATADRPAGEHRTPQWLAHRQRNARVALVAASAPTTVVTSFDRLADRLIGTSGPRVLSPGDVCPDNNVIVDGKVRLFDFEGCGDMHPAMDVAYLALPNPTCWCSFDIPDVVKQEAVATYLDGVEDSAGVDELRLAFAFSAVVSLGLAAGQTNLDEPWTNDKGLLMPSPAQRLVHRLHVAVSNEQLKVDEPLLVSWLAGQLAGLRDRWPNAAPLPVAPAFR